MGSLPPPRRLSDVAVLADENVLNPELLAAWTGALAGETTAPGRLDRPDRPVLVVLAAGKGTRFGRAPKCIQPVGGRPLARHAIDAFRQLGPALAICVVGYEHEAVIRALGADNLYVRSADPAGGTAFAAFEAFSAAWLREENPLLVITMGDRVVPAEVFERLIRTHQAPPRAAELTFLTALYPPPRHVGKGRVVRDQAGTVVRILEQRDIDAIEEESERRRLNDLVEGNCPLYAVRAATLLRHLAPLQNDNAQRQFYLTDAIEAVSREGGLIRTVTVSPADPAFEVLCADVTRPEDLPRLEDALRQAGSTPQQPRAEPAREPAAGTGPLASVDAAVRAIVEGRPPVQVAAIARQIEALLAFAAGEGLRFAPEEPAAIGISGGRLRLAFMHPDMVRFFGPAWQMPLGAGQPDGEEQIVLLMQHSRDGRIHLHPREPRFHERLSSFPAGLEAMYPDSSVTDETGYEAFGTRMSEFLLEALGYLTDGELRARLERGETVPPPGRGVSANLRRPWPLVANALASFRTLRTGEPGARVQARLGRAGFRGVRIMSTGSIPEGGFSSSSAVTVATLNALDALHDLGAPPDVLVRLACQAEYGTGVRAGSLDQATEQKGRPGLGTLISSNPRDRYRTLGLFPARTDRIEILFPYSVPRDREAWRWSWGAYAEAPAPGRLTTVEVRKMTGKAAAIAAILTRLPLETDFFPCVEDDFVRDGALSEAGARWVASVLRQLPLRVTQPELQDHFATHRTWLADALGRRDQVGAQEAAARAEATFASLLVGWRDPVLRRTAESGAIVEETGLPLRAIVAYLFGEVAKNFRLVHHPEEWTACVASSQLGDRCVDLDPAVLPPRAVLESELPWETGVRGPALLDRWLDRFGATPFDFNRGLDDATLSAPVPPEFHRLPGSNFFRGLALIDLAEAMLVRAFGQEAVAVRINAAGQGDSFQVHVDRRRADPEEVKEFIRRAFYRRFGLKPSPEFVAVSPGGGAVGVRVHRYDALPALARALHAAAARAATPH